MKKKKSRIVTVLIMCLCAFTAIGIGGSYVQSDSVYAAEVGSLNTFDEFTIAGFINYYDRSIASLEDQTRDLARSGINWIDTPTWYASLTGNNAAERNFIEYEEYPYFNELCRELNIYFSMCPSDSLLNESEVETLTEYARDLDRCIGYYVKDEPSAAQFQSVANLARKILENDSTRFPYVNLFPNYAGASNLGGSYEDYVRSWVATAGDTIEYLYFDHYPFTQYEKVRASYFSDVEIIRKVAWENNRLKTGGYTQMGWWNGMRRPTVAEARWSMNSLLTYGVKSISHFCWVSPKYINPPSGEGMQDFVLTSDGKPTDRYEPMQKLNWQTRQLGPVLMSFDVAHAYHTGDVPTGTEELPRSFLLQPSDQSDNLIFSLGYSKDDSEKYVMIFNKELEGKKTYTVNVDKTSGLSSLTWYKPDDYEVLPDYTKPLAPAEEIDIDVSTGSFNVELDAGEMRLYKLNGDVEIKEPLQAPQISHKSGTYLGQQTVTLTSVDSDADIYYTTDGTYPTYKSTRYDAPITVGQDGEFGFYIIKAIAVRGNEISDAVTAQYVISDGAQNVALGKPVVFTGNTETFQGIANASLVNDGYFDAYNVFGSTDGQPCFAVIDFEKEYMIDRVVVKAWHDWAFTDVIVQLSESADFTSGVYTVFNNDTDNSVGVGAGTDGAYIENPSGGHSFTFAPVRARYMRFYNQSAQNTTRKSIWEEMQAYTAYDEGTELLTSQDDWLMTGGGTWSFNDGVLSQTDVYDTVSWDRSYTYTKQKFKNFILEGKFKMNVTDPAAWGYVGFGLYKPSVYNLQSSYDKGYYVVVEPKGRALIWNGAKPELGPEDANIVGFTLGSEFTLRVVSVGDTISVSVNGKPVMYVQNEILNREAGYISIHGGLIPIDVSSVRIVELDETQKPIKSEDNIKTVADTKIAVERYTTKAEVLENLPSSVQVGTVAGVKYDLPVSWTCNGYDPSATGYVVFTGTFVDLPEGLKNISNLTATANVFIKPYTDKHDLIELIALGRSLDSQNFTPESWEQMIIKLEAAEALLADPFMVQNDIGVGVWQLYDEIYGLVSILDRTSLRTAIDRAIEEADSGIYTAVSEQNLRAAIENAELTYTNSLASAADLAAAQAIVEKAERDAVTLSAVKSPAQRPDDVAVSTEKKGCGSSAALLGSIPASIVLTGAAVVTATKRKKKGEE